MYKNGNYTYKSKESYETLLLSVMVIFIIGGVMLYTLRFDMNPFVFGFTYIVDIAMVIHLLMRWCHAKGYLSNYPFNEM